jgi:pimeloyl-ACP methyl ester carboxylesterase
VPSVRVGDIDVYYTEVGTGEPLLLIMGFGGDHTAWAFQQGAFARRYRVVAFDNRGAGQTSAPDQPYTTAMMAADARGLMDALGIDRAHVIGVSMGGMIAQEYAIAHPDRLLSASFCSTYAHPGPFCSRMFSCWRDLVPTLGVGFTQREVLLWAFTTDFFEERTAELEEVEALMASNPQPAEGYLAQLRSIETHDTRGRLAAVTCPAMTLVGREDILIYPKLSRRLHDELPDSTWVEVPGGHACLWEFPDAFNEAALSFLASAGGR